MDDIVARLRDVTEMNWDGDEVVDPLCEEAAADPDEREGINTIHGCDGCCAIPIRIVVCPCCREVVRNRTHRHLALDAIRMLAKNMEARRG